jgi:NAD(P)H-flavin reductase
VVNRKHATVLRRRNLTEEIVELTLRPLTREGEAFRAGQYLMVEVENGDSRPYSIASPPGKPSDLELCFHRIPQGQVSNYLADRKDGDDVCYTGPHGRFSLREESARDLLFIAGGTGVTPLRSMILDLLERQVTKRIDLLFGCRSERDLIYAEEFRHLESHYANFRYHVTASRETGSSWPGHRGRVTAALPELSLDVASREAYVCGPPEMVTDVIELLVRSGLDRENCHREGD